MATGSQAVADIARMTEVNPSHVEALARALREAGDDLWPQGARRWVRPEHHVRPHHLANLGIALATGDTMATVAERVRAFRRIRGRNRPHLLRPFGDVFDNLIEQTSGPEGAALRNALTVQKSAVITLTTTGATLVIGINVEEPAATHEFKISPNDEVDAATQTLSKRRGRGFALVGLIFPELILLFADLWADSRAAIEAPELPKQKSARKAKSGTSSPKEVPLSNRPSDQNVADDMRNTDNRSLDNRDPTPCECGSAMPVSAGGQPSTSQVLHDAETG